MTKNYSDKVYDDVRKRMAEIAASAGVDTGRISLEVLFLLPAQFIRQYRWLFDQALDDPMRPITDGGKDEGRVKASGAPNDAMRARSMGGAKKAHRTIWTYWPVRDDEVLKIKRNLDRQIVRAVERAVADVSAMRAARSGKPEPLHQVRLNNATQCGQCGKFMREEWLRCPHHL